MKSKVKLAAMAAVSVLVACAGIAPAAHGDPYPTVRVCKERASNLVTGTFYFDFAFNSGGSAFVIPVQAGECEDVPILHVSSGSGAWPSSITVTEQARPGYLVTEIRATPSAALLSSSLSTRSGTLDPSSGFVTIYFRNARTVSTNPR